MCGRFVMSTSADDLMAEFGAGAVETDELAADYNVAPTKDVYAVLERPPRREPSPLVRQLRATRWGLVPSWADDPSGGARLINARVETVAEKPAFRQAFAVRRCLIPADGYYEWHGEGRSGRRQPYFLHPADGGLLAMAGVYELWRDRSRPHDAAAWLWTVAIITGAARGPLAELHDRMPLAVGRKHYDAWLDPGTTDAEQLRGLLSPPHERLAARPVSTAVNDVRAGGPGLLAPAPAEPADLTLF